MKVLFFGFMILLTMIIPTIQAQTEYGATWDRTCEGNLCTLHAYKGFKYYQVNGTWTPYQNEFQTRGCASSSVACINTNDYQVEVKGFARENNTLTFIYEGNTLGITPVELAYHNGLVSFPLKTARNIPPRIDEEMVVYDKIFSGNNSITFFYTPKKLKQYLTLEEPLPPMILPTKGSTLDYTFKINYPYNIQLNTGVWNKVSRALSPEIFFLNQSNQIQFFIPKGIAWDNYQNFTRFNYEIDEKFNEIYITLKIPYEWINSPDRVYPIVIDPTVSLEEDFNLWDGYVRRTATFPVSFQRFENGFNALVGRTQSPLVNTYRSAITWNITTIPSDAVIVDFTMNLTVGLSPSPNQFWQFYHMDGNNDSYNQEPNSDLHFWTDMKNGTNYLNQTVVAADGLTVFNFTNTSFLNDFIPLLRNQTGNWTLGIVTQELTGGTEFAAWRAKELDGNHQSLDIVYLTPVNITLNAPKNKTIFATSERGKIVLNWTVHNLAFSEWNMTVRVFGNNETPINNEFLLWENITIHNDTTETYNWTVPLVKNITGTQLLLHFDNRSSFGENSTHFYDFSGQGKNGTLQGNPIINMSNEIHASNLVFDGAGDRVLINECNYSCYRLRNATYMTWLKTASEGSGTRGIFSSFLFGAPAFGFSITSSSNSLLVFGDSISVADNTFFTGMNNTWVHMAVAQRENGTIDIYKNGNRTATGAISSIFDLDPFAIKIHVGEFSSNVPASWKGAMDDFIIINRTLSQKEIQEYVSLQEGTYYWYVTAQPNANAELNVTSEEWNFEIVEAWKFSVMFGLIMLSSLYFYAGWVKRKTEKSYFPLQLTDYMMGGITLWSALYIAVLISVTENAAISQIFLRTWVGLSYAGLFILFLILSFFIIKTIQNMKIKKRNRIEEGI